MSYQAPLSTYYVLGNRNMPANCLQFCSYPFLYFQWPCVFPHPRLGPLDHPTSHSTSCRVSPACRHSRTLSRPFGIIGHVIRRASKTRARRWVGVRMGMMGVGSALCGSVPGSGCEARCGGSARRESGMVRRSGRRTERKRVLRPRSCVDSWKRLDE